MFGFGKPKTPKTPEQIKAASERQRIIDERILRQLKATGIKTGRGATRASINIPSRALNQAGQSIVRGITTFGGGRFKGIRHPDSLVDPKMKWLYNPPASIAPLGHKPTTHELYFGRRRQR